MYHCVVEEDCCNALPILRKKPPVAAGPLGLIGCAGVRQATVQVSGGGLATSRAWARHAAQKQIVKQVFLNMRGKITTPSQASEARPCSPPATTISWAHAEHWMVKSPITALSVPVSASVPAPFASPRASGRRNRLTRC